MKKIISLFVRNHAAGELTREVTPGAEWVTAGEGIATRKLDGTCCMVRDGKLYKRYELKDGKTPPPGFEPATDVDPNTGKIQGWVPVGDGPDDRWHREAFAAIMPMSGPRHIADGTYELLGPKVQGNPEQCRVHVLVPHGGEHMHGVPRTYDELREYLAPLDIEGIVWHHPDGRMVKIKKKDFGLPRKPEGEK